MNERFINGVLRVPQEIAAEDACRAEHVLGPETCARTKDVCEPLDGHAMARDDTLAQTLLREGQSGTLVRIAGRHAARIRRVGQGMRLGEHVRGL